VIRKPDKVREFYSYQEAVGKEKSCCGKTFVVDMVVLMMQYTGNVLCSLYDVTLC